jgi:hypothetical protein
MMYTGSCHCGQVRFEVEGEINDVIECNCSICARKGALLWGTSADKFRLLTSPDDLSTYRFNKEAIGHRFCPTCGMHPYAQGLDRSGKDFVMVNVRCVEGLDAGSLNVQQFDGRAL